MAMVNIYPPLSGTFVASFQSSGNDSSFFIDALGSNVGDFRLESGHSYTFAISSSGDFNNIVLWQGEFMVLEGQQFDLCNFEW